MMARNIIYKLLNAVGTKKFLEENKNRVKGQNLAAKREEL